VFILTIKEPESAGGRVLLITTDRQAICAAVQALYVRVGFETENLNQSRAKRPSSRPRPTHSTAEGGR